MRHVVRPLFPANSACTGHCPSTSVFQIRPGTPGTAPAGAPTALTPSSPR